MTMECPAEIYIERVSPSHSGLGTCYRYVWEICQPDAHWGVLESGIEDSLVKVQELAMYALRRVHKVQGYL